MKRLNNQNLNTPELVNGLFKTRWYEDVHNLDDERFAMLGDKFKGGKYLDVGCFNSPYPGKITHLGEIWALDHANEVVEKMQSFFPDVHYVCGDFFNMPFENESFDYLVAGEVIEHTEKPEDFVKEIMRVLKPGGTLALSTPYEETISQPLVSEEHLWAFTEKDLYDLLSPYGEVEFAYYKDSVRIIIAYVTKK